MMSKKMEFLHTEQGGAPKMKDKTIFLFQGMGCNHLDGILHFDDWERRRFEDYCQQIKDHLHIDLLAFLEAEPVQSGECTIQQWLSIFTTDVVIYDSYRRLGYRPDYMYAFSMGLTTACVCAGALDFIDAAQLICQSYAYSPTSKRDRERMAIVIGLDFPTMNRLMQACPECYLAGYNNDTTFLISGLRDSVEQVVAQAAERGAMISRLINSPYAYHCCLAEENIASYAEHVAATPFKKPQVPIYSMYRYGMMSDPARLKQEVVQNMFLPMRWKQGLEHFVKQGANLFIDVSIKGSTTKFTRPIAPECTFLTYKTIHSQARSRLRIA